VRYRILQRWHGPGGCAEVLVMSLPLTISIGAQSIQMFIDRMFLTWYSADAMSAAMQAGITSFAIGSLFVGTASYVNTFVAQYTGANRADRTGPAVWQGIYFSVMSGLIMLCLIPLARVLFDWMGHEQVIRHNEVVYFQIMCIGMLPVFIASCLSGFFIGQSRTRIVMYANLIATTVNILLDYVLIFGKWGFPRWGVAGAAWATVIASFFSVLLYLCLFFRSDYRARCASLSGWRFEAQLFLRLIHYGLPNGVQFMLDVCAFAVFIMLIGRIDRIALAATSIAFGINTLAFMPMLGVGIAVTALVGQGLGKNQPALAQRSTWSGFYLTYGYMLILALGYWLLPDLFIYPFAVRADIYEFALIRPIVVKLLCFVAFYCLFDTGNIIFSAALKGAGDTRFVMVVVVILGWLVMVLPSWIAVKFGYGLYTAWSFVTAYVCILALVFLLRFLAGKWKKMRVIEVIPPSIPTRMSQVPTVEIKGG
jgi:MATE family multidrug resistance protein